MSYKTANVFDKEFQIDKIISKIKAIKKITLSANESATKIHIKYNLTGIRLPINPHIRGESADKVDHILYDVIYDVISGITGDVPYAVQKIPKVHTEHLIPMIEKELKRVNLLAKRLLIEKKNYMKNLQAQIKAGHKFKLTREEIIKIYDESLTEKLLTS